MPAAIGRVLNLVRKLIGYGKQIADTIQQRAATPDFARLAKPFGTPDLAVILTRITNGLRRAAALEARLCRRAARGQDPAPAPIRLSAPRGPLAVRQAAPPNARPKPQPASFIEDPRLVRLLTEEEIAGEVRRRPVGAVIADICHDLGIAPGRLDPAFWDEIKQVIRLYGGNLVDFVQKVSTRWFTFRHADTLWPRASPRLPTPATGPP